MRTDQWIEALMASVRQRGLDGLALGLTASASGLLAVRLCASQPSRIPAAMALALGLSVALYAAERRPSWVFLPALGALHLLALSESPLFGFVVGATAAFALRTALGSGGLEASPSARRWPDPYSWALLGLTLALTAHHVGVAQQVAHNFDNDAAYYYAVARHIAEEGSLTEPLVWHTLHLPPSVVHPAFDFWQGLTCLVLVPGFAWLGASHELAATTMALVAGAAGVGLWHLICEERLVRSRFVQTAAVLTFALTPALSRYRLDTETACVFQLALVAALLAIARRRLGLAVVSAFLLLLTRGDGSLSMLAIWAACLVLAVSWRGRLALVVLMAGLAGIYAAWNLAHFGAPTPPGAAQVPFLRDYMDLYRLEAPRLSAESVYRARLEWSAVTEALGRARATYGEIPYLGAGWVVLPLAALGALGAPGTRTAKARVAGTCVALVFVVPVIAAWASPIVYSPWRTLHGLVPAMIVLAALGLEAALELTKAASPRWRALAEAVVVSGTLVLLANWLELVPSRDPLAVTFVQDLQARRSMLGTATVLTNGPWWVAAETDARVVILPLGDRRDIESMVRRYDAEYVLLSRTCCGWSPSHVERWHDLLEAGGPALRLTLVDETDRLWLYRVVR